MKSYRCPTCGKTLTKTEYEKALRIHAEREHHFQQKEAELTRRDREQRARAKQWEVERRKRERQLKKQAQEKLQDERNRIRESERARAERQQVGLKDQLQKLKERLRQRQMGTTPQSEGLEFEEKLVARLDKEFPEDEVIPKGKGGDILHIVMINKKPAGTIVYECKRTASIQSQHIKQTYRAKQTREADFAVLVTTGRKKGFSGFAHMGGVSVVSPLAVIPLASLLRAHLIEMARLRITKEKRAIIAQELMGYIDSAQFKNPIEEVIQRSGQLREMIKKEAKDHWRVWNERWTHYDKISWNSTQIQGNLRLVMHGEKPKSVSQPKTSPLQLPAARSN